jgi:hypothetical protein
MYSMVSCHVFDGLLSCIRWSLVMYSMVSCHVFADFARAARAYSKVRTAYRLCCLRSSINDDDEALIGD